MDFFKAQDEARRRTRWLVVWFGLAVAGVVAIVYVLAGYGLLFSGLSGRGEHWDQGGALGIALLVGLVMLLGSLFKHGQLARGGLVVARDLGGRPVDRTTTDNYERRLLNVVDEMAIASGIPAPEVWVLDDEEGINAFAAGTEPGNAVVGVTRGCLERLTRAELQGVVAHEFSHILNGDMRLNMRLIGWIFGLVMISIIGRSLVNMLRHVRISSGSSRDSKGASGVVLVVLVVGLSLWIIGLIGVLFARLIQAAISRQREFLADASAVQFTRDPSGIAGALVKIGGLAGKGTVRSPNTVEARHLFFAEASMFSLGMATHPPLEQRIRAIDPAWDGRFVAPERQRVAPESRRRAQPPPLPGVVAGMAALDSLGDAGRIDRGVGAALLTVLDPEAVDAVRTREEGKAMMLGLLLAQDDVLRRGEIDWLREHVGGDDAERALHWRERLAGARSAEKIAYIDLALPALRRMGQEELREFLDATGWLIASDGEVNLFEFMLRKLLARHLLPQSRAAARGFGSLAALEQEVSLLASTFAHLSDTGAGDAFAVAAGAYRDQTGRTIALLPGEACTLGAIDRALDRCQRGSSVVREQLLRICGIAALRDDRLGDDEVELLRAVADAIGTPLPPFVEERMFGGSAA